MVNRLFPWKHGREEGKMLESEEVEELQNFLFSVTL